MLKPRSNNPVSESLVGTETADRVYPNSIRLKAPAVSEIW